MALITCIKSEEVTRKSKGGKPYSCIEFGYQQGDKAKSLQLFKTANPEIYEVAKAAKPDDVFEAEFEQNERDFWQFKKLVPTGAQAPKPAAKTTSKGDWETREERMDRQHQIARQSSIANALKLLELQGAKKVGVGDVTRIAAQLEDFVFSGDADYDVVKENNVPEVE